MAWKRLKSGVNNQACIQYGRLIKCLPSYMCPGCIRWCIWRDELQLGGIDELAEMPIHASLLSRLSFALCVNVLKGFRVEFPLIVWLHNTHPDGSVSLVSLSFPKQCRWFIASPPFMAQWVLTRTPVNTNETFDAVNFLSPSKKTMPLKRRCIRPADRLNKSLFYLDASSALSWSRTMTSFMAVSSMIISEAHTTKNQRHEGSIY